jgi:Tfp pilus assembly protein FimV
MLRVNLFLSMPVFIKRATEIITILFICSGCFAAHADTEQTASRRIEVYALSQNYWDTQNGDTLGAIVLQLLPNNPAKLETLKQDIVQLNPDAFIGGDPDKLLANKRLWLPGYMKQADTRANPDDTVVEHYSWGNIKRQRH